MHKKILSVSIGIPVYNEEANIGILLNRLLSQRRDGFIVKEIIVVSDGSTDSSITRVRKIQNKLIRLITHRKRKGQNARLNEIFRSARGDVVVIFDADTLPQDDRCLFHLISPFKKNSPVGFVHGTSFPISISSPTFFERIQIFADQLKEFMLQRLKNGANIYVAGAGRALRRTVARTMRLPQDVSEDSYMYLACLHKGISLDYQSRSVVNYKSCAQLGDYFVKTGKYSRGRRRLYRYFPKALVDRAYHVPIQWLFEYFCRGIRRSPLLTLCYLSVLFFSRIHYKIFPQLRSQNTIASSTKNLEDVGALAPSLRLPQVTLGRMVVLLLMIVSVIANIYFFSLTVHGVGFGDAWSRLNIARRVVDSLTPGIAQLGGIWLPFPQILITPFAAIDPLYFSGLAAMFVSSPAFILGGWYLFRIVLLISGNRLLSVIGTFVYAGNINLLYIQTTSMSEPIFLCAMLGTMYHFLRWKKDEHQILSLIICAFWVFVATLTRYEGYFLLFAALLCVAATAYVRRKSFTYLEGMVTLFGTLASFGLFLWFTYSWVIFGHPLNWLRIYTGKIAVISTVSQKPQDTWGVSDFKYDIVAGIRSILESSLQMNGLLLGIPIIITLVATPLFLFKKSGNRLTIVSISLLSCAPLIFYIMSSFGGSALIRNPPISKAMIMDPQFHLINEYNIRYGLMTLPLLLIVPIAILGKKKSFRLLFAFIALLQVGLHVTGWPTTIYNFPKRFMTIGEGEGHDFREWFSKNYDGGLILSSAIANDQIMYTLKLPYKNFIYEGTGKYWKQAVSDPASIVRWVMYQNGPKVTNTGGSADFVSFYLQDTLILTEQYNLVYTDDRMVVYKIKDNSRLSSLPIPEHHP